MMELFQGPSLGVVGIVVMLAGLFLFRLPAAFALALVGFFGIAMASGFSSAFFKLGSGFWDIFSSPALTVIPMFILLGEFIFHAGYSDRLYHATDRWFGHLRGGLAVSTVAASAGFSAICGSNTATAATMSTVAVPAMKKFRYHPTLSTGAVAAGSTLGVMVPPSIVLVVYGLTTKQSIGKLFFGTVIPSILLTLFMMATIWVMCVRHPDWGPKGQRSTWREKVRALPEVMDVLILFCVIMFALLRGLVTPTEAAATSCFLGLVLCVVRRRLSWKAFNASIVDTLRISCMVFMIIAGATIFGHFMTITRLPYEVVDWVSALHLPNWVILVIIMGCYVIGGCLMDALAFLLISLPIFFPLVQRMGYDPIWFGQVICLVTTLGAITPPIGICCYVIAGMFRDVRLEQVFKGAMYFLPAYVLTIILLMLFPDFIVGWLADMAR